MASDFDVSDWKLEPKCTEWERKSIKNKKEDRKEALETLVDVCRKGMFF